MSDFDDFLFEELDGQKRRIILTGPIAPFGGPRSDPAFTMGGSVRNSEKFVAGRRAPFVHVTGTKENGWEVKGEIRDQYLGHNGAARDYVDRIEAIREAARPLRIVWGDQLRRGLLEDAQFGVEGERDFKYELKFKIYDKGKRAKTDLDQGTRVVVGPAEISTNVAAAFAGLKIPGMPFGIQSKLDALYAGVTAPLGDAIAMFETAAQDVSALGQIAPGFAARCKTIFGRLTALISFVETMADPTIALFSEPDEGRRSAALRKAQAEALAALDRALTQVSQLGTTAERTARGAWSGKTTIAKDGDTLEEIARRVGTSRAALAKLNPNLPLRLTPGTVVKIP